MEVWNYFRNNQSDVLHWLWNNAWLAGVPLVVGFLLALPIGYLASRYRWIYPPTVTATGLLYTIPSLALFALLGPLLGLSFSAALIGLVLYALLSVVRNALTGLRQVPPEVRDAATGMGYGRLGLLWRVELPLAWPSILTGLRIATVSTVALVTVCTVVSYGGFGNLILTGFNNNYYKPQIMAGTLGCLALALILDLLLVGLGRLTMPWARRRAAR